MLRFILGCQLNFRQNKMGSFIMLLFFIFFVGTISQNTHQNITFKIPSVPPFRMFLKTNDKVVASLKNTNARFLIAFLSQDRQILLTEEGHCFKPQVCKLQFKSKWNVIGWVMYQIYYSHQYDYEIRVNDRILKSQHIYSLVQAQTFVYPYLLQPKTYSLTLYFQSQLVKALTFTFLDKDYTIKANRKMTINVNVTEITPNYSFYFQLPDMDLQSLTQNFNVQISVSVPYQMLKNCNGLNKFDERLKACGQLVQKDSDTLVIERYGIASHFTLHRTQSVMIRITLIQLMHFFQQLDVPILTSFLIHGVDPSVFRQRSVQWVLQHYQSQYQQCEMEGDQCVFKYVLSAGRYAFLPFLPSHLPEFQFVYLFQRLNDKEQIIQSFYSVFPVQIDNNIDDESFFAFNGFMLQFTPTTDQLMQIQIHSQHQIVVEAYSINKKNEIDEDETKSVFELIQMGLQNSFTSDLTKVNILTDLEPNKPHIFYLKFHSREYFVNHMQEGNDKYEIFSTDPKMQNTSITIKLTNGKFPHPKIQQKIIQGEDNDFIDDGNAISQEEKDIQNNSLPINLVLTFIGLVTIILALIVGLIVLMIKNHRKKKVLSELESNRSLLSSNNIIHSVQQIDSFQQKQNPIKNQKNQLIATEVVQQKIIYIPYNDQQTQPIQKRPKKQVQIEMSQAIITQNK